MINTERLILRPHTLADFEDLCAMWGDPAVMKHFGGVGSTREECWARLMRYVGHWQIKGFGFWVVADKDTGAYLGELGLMDFMRTLDAEHRSFGEAPEMGWSFTVAAHGKGYATEAGAAALAWADAHFGRTRIVCMISPSNEPSKRVASRLGFQEYARAVYKGDVLLYERP
ncbi:MAG: GNAT family N-acetyltransferase [Hyphomonadaceae bacterium]|nr:GNAT family N-acetyltransferase [Hyphomonadaceae bacterium]